MNKDEILTEDEFDARFHLITNPFNPNAGWNGCVFETFGQELAYIRKQPPACIWTLIDGDDGGLWLVSGYHHVNRVNYLISKEPVPENQTIQVRL